ncbi:circadian clock protein KaiA [Trichothermofontia sp.]
MVRSSLAICSLLNSDALAKALSHALGRGRYHLSQFHHAQEFLEFVCQEERNIDCLILQESPVLAKVAESLHQSSVMLPTLIVCNEDLPATVGADEHPGAEPLNPHKPFYHAAEVKISLNALNQVGTEIDHAIREFLRLSPTNLGTDAEDALIVNLSDPPVELQIQQRRLAEKLKERLGYLGVYYKRDPKNFLRNLSLADRHAFMEKLKANYRNIVILYFSDEETLNKQIDEFVNDAFFSDIPVTQIVELHMELMDQLSKQLKLEGRNEDILLDYRLTLIDVLSHLCEMYRRSIPRES